MRIAIASDHGGRALRLAVCKHLTELSHQVTDHGTDTDESVDYPLYAERVGSALTAGKADLGILVCGTGVGMSMAANRIPGVRAALCTNEYTARLTRAHNDANVLCMGQRVLGEGVALGLVDAFVSGHFEGGRHARRLEQLTALERKKA